jgi:AcrR family transcriptional regulator
MSGGDEGEGSHPSLSAYRLPRGRHSVPPEQVADNQRWRLLGATAEVLAERGYARVRISDVAARAGVSRGTFYEQFDDLPACLLAAFEMVADCVCDLARSACEVEGGPARRQAALEQVLGFLAEEPALARLLGADVAAGVAPIAAARADLIERLAGLGADRHSVEGALALASERIAVGEAWGLPELAPQLAVLISPRPALSPRGGLDPHRPEGGP